MIHMKLDLCPVPKGRPRMTKAGTTYTPKRTREFEQAISTLVKDASALLGALILDVTFILKRPKSAPKSQLGRYFRAGSRGDLDNYIKALMDGLQRGGVIPNDAAVVRVSACKAYAAPDESPHIEFRLRSIGEISAYEEECYIHAREE